jgi:c-di-GMP phosphodiesterase
MGKISPLFARQPIFDKHLNVFGYELLFRSSQQNSANFLDGDQASSHVMLYAFGEHRINDIIGEKKAFINFTRNLLMMPPPLPPTQLVIEILEDIECDDLILASVKKLRREGYEFALDDFVVTKDTQLLLRHTQIVKIDVLSTPPEVVEQMIKKLKTKHIKLIAEKIETHEMMQTCIKQGFDWFQGYFLSKPQIIQGIKVSGGTQALLQLLACLTAAEVDVDAITQAIGSDPRLSFKMLKMVNASSNGLNRKITSINQSVMLLGIEKVRNWASLLLLASNEDKPEELCLLSSTRAKLCESLGQLIDGKKFGEACFTLGLLSSFDAFLDLSLDKVVSQLNLSDEMKNALLENKGKLGHMLGLVLELERSNWSKIAPVLRHYNISEQDLTKLYVDAIAWANQLHKQIQAG